MRIGFGLITMQRYPGEVRTDEQLYAEGLDLAMEAEAAGFDSVWTSEHHFVDDGYLPAVLPMSAAIAARTGRVAIGTALLLAPLYEPLRLAEDAAVVDLISRGRLILGLGNGWRREEFDALGVGMSERANRLVDTIHVLRQAWGSGLVVGTDQRRYPGVSVTPKPARAGGPPLWIGGFAEAVLRRTGRLADGFMATEVTPEEFGAQVRTIDGAAREAGRDPRAIELSLHMPTFAWESAEGWDLVRDHHHYVSWKYEDMEDARGRTSAAVEKPVLSSNAEAALRQQIVMGSPGEVARQIAAYQEAAGRPIHYIARLYWPGMSAEVQRRTMRLFAEEVIPRLH